MRPTISVLIALAAASTLAAQTISESMEVRVANIDVVVTDAQGNPVPGLTREDFTLLENGRPVEITNFYEERGASDARPVDAEEAEVAMYTDVERKPRLLVILLDESSLMPNDRDRTLDHLADLIDRVVEQRDRAMIVSFDERLTIRQEFTGDRDLLIDAIESFRGSGTRGLLLANRFRQLQEELIQQLSDATGAPQGEMAPQVQVAPASYSSAMGDVRDYAQEEQSRNNRLMASLESIVVSLAGLEGRKSIVFVTNSFTRNPGVEAHEFMEVIKEKFEDGRGMSPRMEGRRFSLQNEFLRLTQRASSVGVVIHVLQGAAGSSQLVGADFGNSGGFEATQGAISGLRERDMDQRDSMQELAATTGGIALVGSSNIEGALERVGAELENHYSLGYRPAGERDSTRRIEVKVRRPGLIVRHPQILVDRSVDQEMKDRLATVLNFPDMAISHGLEVSAGPRPAVTEGRYEIPLTLKIPTANLTLLPDGDDLVGSFSVHSGFLSREGALSDVSVQQQSFRFPAESRNRRQTVTLQLSMTIDERVERVAIAVVDGPSQLAQVAVHDVAPSGGQ